VSWIVANIHRIMLVSGVLTMMMVYAALAPEAALRSTFGESVSGPVANIVVRNWGALIALVGAMLIYGARKVAVRPLVLAVAGASKAIFVALVLSHGGRFLGYQAGIAVLVDALWVIVFAAYLLSVRHTPTGDLNAGPRPVARSARVHTRVARHRHLSIPSRRSCAAGGRIQLCRCRFTPIGRWQAARVCLRACARQQNGHLGCRR
jgi:hypothetical protein